MRINKGVELLLKRRETNPEEFGIGASSNLRWVRLLAAHDVDLNDPEQEVLNADVFANEVMDRLLTAKDLQRKSSGISRAQLLKELLPGLNDLFGKEYAKYTEEIKEKFNE